MSESLPEAEQIKRESRYLRGSLRESLADKATGALREEDTHLSKFHGLYQQDDRDLREERRQQKLEPHFQFMLRLRLPGGVVTPQQWWGLDRIADEYADGSLRLTTRQTFQFHRVFKEDLPSLIQDLDVLGLDSRGACGDVNRNVVTNVNPHLSASHQTVYEAAVQISERLNWRSAAYEEVWLNQPAKQTDDEEEPFYTHRYLPRKFKVAIALPPHNDCDVLANDIGLIAIEENGKVIGYNIAVGGGMGMTYGDRATYPRLATPVGFVPADQVVDACEAIVAIQRDHGCRTNRAHARFKYTLDDHGLDWFKEQFAQVHGQPLEDLRDYTLTDSGDRFGWTEDDKGFHHLTLCIPSGRIRDFEHLKLRTALHDIAKIHSGEFRITCNQNLIIARVSAEERAAIQERVDHYALDDGSRSTPLARNAISCVAFPTCGLAMAESERYLPELTGKIHALMEAAGIGQDTIHLRVSGCPNGCARPYLGEIALTGKAPGKYNLFLGADTGGQRLNRLYRENIDESQILTDLKPLLERYAQEREADEGFGDFLYRDGVLSAHAGSEDFHQPLIAQG
ncbi:NADPH-dependent assimilatory sulfite reductase hemoprotein subunit [Marinimicrobium agarilyticum]|uniref:NADPH-dependent assimilatory sulfite reductase hemoprotein subunit n=1 Tax=Marinimicrobium agarilyticum TaxID=306546 RepID=UPI0003F96A99|nr:NADPH-dependent assimilatory sulfite reductase hemoprotein subunit [Marinimicrobium agarilyticum]